MYKKIIISLITAFAINTTIVNAENTNIEEDENIDMSPETALGADKGYKSVYTPLSPQSCITIKEWETGAKQECAGIAGFRIHLIDDDDRQSLTLIKGDKIYPLEFWRSVSPNFSELGKLIEWRVAIDDDNHGIYPIALIVRLKTTGEKPSSDLVLVDLQREDICVVDVIPPYDDGLQNEAARSMANQAVALHCLDGSPIVRGSIE